MATTDQQQQEQGESLQSTYKILIDQSANMTNRVSLARLIELGVQRTYHELTILAELLPRKTDLERKIEIVNFVSRTRQIFVRLLALVKWAGGASKVEQCMDIVSFLDKQALLFINTADNMANIARTTLVQARLPSFQLPCAVEVLTLGTYSKMPTCIRDRIVPPDPITPQEKKLTLLKLNHIIEQKLSVSSLPVPMRSLKIEYGRVTFHVDNEFDLTLTLLGDSQNMPWKVLNVDILVEDSDTGEGKDLVHPKQSLYILQLLQSRVAECAQPLVEVYNLLHAFCSSLQVEVLHDQMERLLRDRLASFIRIAEYVPGSKLAITYWKSKNLLRIETNKADLSKPLKLIHQPELVIKDEKITESVFKPGTLSIERLIAETTHERAQYKLSQVAAEIKEKNLGSCKVFGTPALLHVACLDPCRPSEELIISIDALNGSYLAHVPQYENSCSITENIQEALNNNRTKLKTYFDQLRIWLTKKRCNKTIEFLSITVAENLPLCTKTNQPKLDENIPRMFFQFNKYNQHYLMTEFTNSEVDPCRVNIKYHILTTETMTGDTIDRELFPDVPVESLQKDLIVVETLMELRVSSIVASSHCHGSITSDVATIPDSLGKRSALDTNGDTNGYDGLWTKRFKRQSKSGFHISELPHLIGFCEERLAYLGLSAELRKRNITHQFQRSETSGSAHGINITLFPPSSSVPNGVSNALQRDVLSITVTLQEKVSKIWMATYVLTNCPVVSQSVKEHGTRRLIFFNYDSTVSAQKQPSKFIDDHLLDWTCTAHLYDAVKEFAQDLKQHPSLHNTISIRSFNYRRICIAYGPDRHYSVTILWRALDKRFHLSFGVVGDGPFNSNPHSTMAIHYKHEFNKHKSIMYLMQNLSTTLSPLSTLQFCTSIPILGVIASRPQVPVQSFCIIALSTLHVRLIYRNTYCLDIKFHTNGLVAIRDGAYSRFDHMKAMEELTPIQGLKAFLNKFVDNNAAQMRRLSQTEDDNPPSPMTHSPMNNNSTDLIDSSSYLFNSNSSQSAQQQSQQPIKNGSPMTNYSHNQQRSNVHSNQPPASPHVSVLGLIPSPSTYQIGSPQASVQSISNASQHHSQQQQQPNSPGLFAVNSPMNTMYAPSPAPFLPSPSPSQPHHHSPAPASQHSTGPGSQNPHDPQSQPVLSPYPPPPSSIGPQPSNISISSPAAQNWPGSPSVSRQIFTSQPSPASVQPMQIYAQPSTPSQGVSITGSLPMAPTPAPASSRCLPQRSWAAAIPTLLTPQGFEAMCRSDLNNQPSLLERFLGCVFMKKNLQRKINSTKMERASEPGVIQLKGEHMLFRVTMDPSMQSLHMKAIPIPDDSCIWSYEEIETLERYFELKVVSYPYKPDAFISFSRLLINMPLKLQKDFIALLRIELYPEQTDPNYVWNLSVCMTIPPGAVPLTNPGMSAICPYKSHTIFFFINLSMKAAPNHNLRFGVIPHSVYIPLLYDMNQNTLSVYLPRVESYLNGISEFLKNYCIDFKQMHQVNPIAPCVIQCAIRELLLKPNLLKLPYTTRSAVGMENL